MGNNPLGKITIGHVVNFFREIIAHETQYDELLPSGYYLKS